MRLLKVPIPLTGILDPEHSEIQPSTVISTKSATPTRSCILQTIQKNLSSDIAEHKIDDIVKGKVIQFSDIILHLNGTLFCRPPHYCNFSERSIKQNRTRFLHAFLVVSHESGLRGKRIAGVVNPTGKPGICIHIKSLSLFRLLHRSRILLLSSLTQVEIYKRFVAEVH